MKETQIELLIEKLRGEWPVVFALTEIDRLSGGALRRRTIHNLRSRGDVPSSCFLLHGARKVLVVRDALLDWWQTQLEGSDR